MFRFESFPHFGEMGYRPHPARAAVYTSGMVRAVLICSFVSVLYAQESGEGSLAQVRAKVANIVGRLSNYMCTETIERTSYVLRSEPKASCAGLLAVEGHGQLVSSDRLRLDVGSSKSATLSNEFYSWAGENHFSDQTIGEIVGNGATSNGSYTALLSMIFTSDPVKFAYIGEHKEAERSLAEFSYETPLAGSHYTYFRQNRLRMRTAYEGAFLVDEKTFDLVELTIRTKGLPLESGGCGADTTVDYQNVPLNGSILLLPSVVRMTIVNTDGSEDVNQTVFSACREFEGESAVHFGDAALAPSADQAAREPTELAVRSGLRFEVMLTQDIDLSKAAAGDAIRGELASPIHEGRKLVASTGTPVTMRIVELRRTYGPPSSISLGLRLENLSVMGSIRTLAARAKGVSLRTRPQTLRNLSFRPRRTDDAGPLTLAFPYPKENILTTNGLKTGWITGP